MMNRKLAGFSIFSALLFNLICTISANALPLPKSDRSQPMSGLSPEQAFTMSRGLPANFTADYDFEGIIALNNCSGSLIKFEGAKDTDPALILTNGHCVETGLAEPGTFTYGKPSSRSFTILKSDGIAAGRVNANLIVYSTMTKTDVTLYRLSLSYADIKARFDVRPFTLASQHPAQQTAIEVISGYWNRGYSCQVEKFITHLKEDQWVWDDSIRYSRPGCEVIGGTSGSPIIASGTRTVIGINNTGNESGEECTLDNPCEIDANGNVTFAQGLSYGEQTYWFYSCLNRNHEVDISVPGCLLPH